MRRALKFIGIGILTVCCFWLLAVVTTDKPEKGGRVSYEIAIDGPAMFFRVDQGARREIWAVDCWQPLRGCVARAPGLVLRIDDRLDPWLTAVAMPDARISIQTRNDTIDAPTLFSAALQPEMVHDLSQPDSFVVIEEKGVLIQRTSTEAINRIVSYLRWVNGATARTLRDARLWPDGDILDPNNMSPEAFERYMVMQRRRNAAAVLH